MSGAQRRRRRSDGRRRRRGFGPRDHPRHPKVRQLRCSTACKRAPLQPQHASCCTRQPRPRSAGAAAGPAGNTCANDTPAHGVALGLAVQRVPRGTPHPRTSRWVTGGAEGVGIRWVSAAQGQRGRVQGTMACSMHAAGTADRGVGRYAAAAWWNGQLPGRMPGPPPARPVAPATWPLPRHRS